MLTALLRPAAALGGAGADKVALHVGQAAENGNHQAPGAGAGVGPRLGKRTELHEEASITPARLRKWMLDLSPRIPRGKVEKLTDAPVRERS